MGWELSESTLKLFKDNNIIKVLGGNKLAITDWKTFAKIAGFKPGSEEYTSALSSYNDALI